MSQETIRRAMSFIGPLQILIIILVLITAFIHLDRAMSMGGGAGRPPGGARSTSVSGAPPAAAARRTGGGGSILSYIPIPLGTLFMLNFVGYIVLGVALYLPPLRSFQRIIRWLLIAFTAVTILAWYLIAGAHPNNTGYIDKTVEVALIILLVIEDWQATHRPVVGGLSRG